jgi:hypothetical protein
MPKDLDLEGRDASEARRAFLQLTFDHPGFEVEAGAITLSEIQDRAAKFDPLTLKIDAGVRAISRNAWASLGRHGLLLHFERKPGQLVEVVVSRASARGKKWHVQMDGALIERFSTIEEAVQAVDYEVGKRGPGARASALAGAAWRRAPAEGDATSSTASPHRDARTGRTVTALGEAMRLAVFDRITRKTP